MNPSTTMFADDLKSPALSFGRVILFLALINAHLGNLFYFGGPASRIISFLLGLFLVTSFLKKPWQTIKTPLTQKYLTALLSYALMFLFLIAKKAGFICLVLALGSLLSIDRGKSERGQIHVFLTTLAFLAVFDYGYWHYSLIWHGVKKTNHLLMHCMGTVTGQKMLYGHHASGFFILISFIFYLFALILCLREEKRSFLQIIAHGIIFFLLILGSQTIYLFLQQVIFARMQINLYETYLQFSPFVTHWLFFLFLLTPLYFLHKGLLPLTIPNQFPMNDA